MDKLFSLQQAIDVIKKRLFETALNNVGVKQNVDETLVDVAENRLETWFDDVMSVQPERKTGRWEPFDVPWYRCSECGAVRENITFMENFCPNCGADMRGDKYETD